MKALFLIQSLLVVVATPYESYRPPDGNITVASPSASQKMATAGIFFGNWSTCGNVYKNSTFLALNLAKQSLINSSRFSSRLRGDDIASLLIVFSDSVDQSMQKWGAQHDVRIIPVDREAIGYDHGNKKGHKVVSPQGHDRAEGNILKAYFWNITTFDVIFFVDNDHFMKAAVSDESYAQLQAQGLVCWPSGSEPLNAGGFILRPSNAVFDFMRHAIQSGFDTQTGWEHLSRNITLDYWISDHCKSRAKSKAVSQLCHQGWTSRWDFIGSGSDQGLLFYAARWGPSGPIQCDRRLKPNSWHFAGSPKPWDEPDPMWNDAQRKTWLKRAAGFNGILATHLSVCGGSCSALEALSRKNEAILRSGTLAAVPQKGSASAVSAVSMAAAAAAELAYTTNSSFEEPGSIQTYLKEHTFPEHVQPILLSWDAHGEYEKGRVVLRNADHHLPWALKLTGALPNASASPFGTLALLFNGDEMENLDWTVCPPVPLLVYTAPAHLVSEPWLHLVPTPFELSGRARHRAGVAKREAPPWEERRAKMFYRGSVRPALSVRVAMGQFGAQPEHRGWLDAEVDDRQSIEDMVRFRYIVDIGGRSGTTWDSLRWKMCSGALVFRVSVEVYLGKGPPPRPRQRVVTVDWWHASLRPWEHYVPVKDDLSDLHERFDWANANPTAARAIAEAGQAVCEASATSSAVEVRLRHVVASLPAATETQRAEASALMAQWAGAESRDAARV